MAMAEWILWSSVLLIAYSYVLYPMLLAVFVRNPPASAIHSNPTGTGTKPAVACIIAAYNEEHHIAARLDNVLAQSYDSAKLSVYVGSDGSHDHTGELIAARHGGRVHAFVFEQNRGKATVLNELVAVSSEPILVFTDANTTFDKDAIAKLVQRFETQRVGAVCGELKLQDATGSNRDSAYWRVEQFLKRREAQIGGLLGANGGIYALRRSLYRPIAADTIIDDFCIAMTAAAEGWDVVYAPDAVAYEDTPDEIADEYHRRVRIGIGNYQALFRHPEYLWRTNWPTRMTYVSHKVLRWLTPLLMTTVLAASALLSFSSPVYFGLLFLQLAVYGAAVAVWHFKLQRRLTGLLAMAFFFLTLNWAFLVAFARYISGQYSGRWRTTMRSIHKSDSSPA